MTTIDVDALANEIRRLGGTSVLGCGALAEALMPFLASHAVDTREADGWIEWKGGVCPVDLETMVDFKRRCDTETDAAWRPEEYRAGDLRWSHKVSARDIIAYRLVPQT